MLKKDILADWVKNNNGVLKVSDAISMDISANYLFEYIKKNEFVKVSKGIYLHPDMWEDQLYMMQLRYKQIVFSHETALYLLDLAEREPLRYTVTAKAHYNSKNLRQGNTKVYTVKEELFELGITEVKTPMNNMVKCYNAERTLCDIVRNRNNTDKQELIAALKNYTKRKERNIPQLMRYAKEFRVEKVMRQYMEVLL